MILFLRELGSSPHTTKATVVHSVHSWSLHNLTQVANGCTMYIIPDQHPVTVRLAGSGKFSSYFEVDPVVLTDDQLQSHEEAKQEKLQRSRRDLAENIAEVEISGDWGATRSNVFLAADAAHESYSCLVDVELGMTSLGDCPDVKCNYLWWMDNVRETIRAMGYPDFEAPIRYWRERLQAAEEETSFAGLCLPIVVDSERQLPAVLAIKECLGGALHHARLHLLDEPDIELRGASLFRYSTMWGLITVHSEFASIGKLVSIYE